MPSEKRKLLILTSSFPRTRHDFAAAFINEFATSLNDQFEITVLAPASSGVPDYEIRDRIKIYRFNYFWPRKFAHLDAAADLQERLARAWWARVQLLPFMLAFFLRACLLARSADIICSHWLVPAGLIGAIIARLFATPHIAIEHSGALHLLQRYRLKWLTHFIVAGSAAIITVSRELRAKLCALCPAAAEKSAVMAMGIDYSCYPASDNIREKWLEKSVFTIVYLGRLVEIKGVKILIDACAGELSARPGFNLIIAGAGEQREELIQYARAKNLPAQFIGAVTGAEKVRLLQGADVVVIPSLVLANGRSEGFPVVCLEAAAAGCAVIASDVGGLREIIVDGETGLRARAGDSAHLRELIIKLWDDRALRRDLGARAQLAAANYDWQIIARKFTGLIDSRNDNEFNISETRTIEE